MDEQPQLSYDDLLDVVDLTKKLETDLMKVLKENDRNTGLSALMSATINCSLAQCKKLSEALLIRNVFLIMFDHTIKSSIVEDTEK